MDLSFINALEEYIAKLGTERDVLWAFEAECRSKRSLTRYMEDKVVEPGDAALPTLNMLLKDKSPSTRAVASRIISEIRLKTSRAIGMRP